MSEKYAWDNKLVRLVLHKQEAGAMDEDYVVEIMNRDGITYSEVDGAYIEIRGGVKEIVNFIFEGGFYYDDIGTITDLVSRMMEVV